MDSKIISDIKKQIDRVEREESLVTQGLTFNLPRTLNKIDLYYSSKFLTGTTDSEGFKKLFSNIIKFRVNAATKAIDIDTKDIRVVANNGSSYYKAWFFQHELRQYMRDEGFAALFNRIAEKAPRYGTAVVKSVGDCPQICNLRNLSWDPTESDIRKSTYINEKHVYNVDEFREAGEELGWDPEVMQQVIDLYEQKGLFEIQTVEHYGYVEKAYLSEDKDGKKVEQSTDFVKARVIVSGLEFYKEDPKKGELVTRPITLDKVEIESWPYRNWHWEEEDGRCLGIGIVEDMFVNQEYHNDISHLERKSLHWSSKKLFQTRDDTAPANLFSDVANGEVLTLKSEITPVSMEERNLPQYNLVFDRIDNNSNQRTFTFEVNTGEALPSGTPFRLGAILSQAVNSHYAYKRENFAIFIKEIIWDFVIPAFKKDRKREHSFKFDGTRDQLEKISAMLIDAHMWKEVQKFQKETGNLPSPEEYARERAKVEAAVRAKDGIHLELPDGFYDDLHCDLEIDIDGESISTADVETLNSLLTIVAQNPQALQNPVTKGILDMIANRSGQNPIDVFGLPATPAPAAPTGIPAGGPPGMPSMASVMTPGAANPATAPTL